MLWLALYCPTLPLDCILRRWPEGLEPALAVTDLDGSRRLIAVATRAAQACGVYAGQSIATALSLLPDLVLIARKLDDERIALTEAALAALRFTPTVSLRASGLVMEISSSLKLFGGRRLLKKSIASAMQVQGLHVAAAEAPTPHGAWLLAQERARQRLQAQRRAAMASSGGPAQAGTGSDVSRGRTDRVVRPDREPPPQKDFAAALDALPIAHLESARPSLQRLDGIGCHTFADLRRLPVKGLARRFGPLLIDELDRAIGDKPDPQVVFVAPSRFETRIELMARVESAEALIFASQRLLAQMAGWLVARRAAVREFTIVLHHDRWTRDAIEPTRVTIALATPSSDLVRFGTLLRERLSRLELAAPVLELALEAPAIVEERESHGALFPEREQASETLARLLEKLTARLGPEAMVRLERVADHRPERAWREVRGAVGPVVPLPASTTRASPGTASRSTGAGGDRAQTGNPIRSPFIQDSRPPGPPYTASASAAGHDLASTAPRSPSGPDGADAGVLSGADASAPPTLTPVRSSGCTCGPRPAWLLAEPQQLEVRAHRPIFESLPLDLLAGPERIESGWWDDAPVTRDYFIAEHAAGRLVWVYRERLPRPGKDLWYLQGLFG